MTELNILGVKINNLSLDEAMNEARRLLNDGNQHFVVTCNPEFLVAAQKDELFQKILNYADLAVADGIGLVYAAKALRKKLHRITGVTLTWQLCQMAEQKKYSVFLLGGGPGIAEQAAEKLKISYPDLHIAGAESGGVITDPKEVDEQLIIRINQSRPDIIFVALGQVKQEKWIYHHLDQLPTVKLAIGVGGTFDYISGVVKYAPAIIRSLGLEWLYRLFTQPKRVKRIIDATVIFPLYFVKSLILKA